MQKLVFYFKFKCDRSEAYKIYQIKWNRFKFWLNIIFQILTWLILVSAILIIKFEKVSFATVESRWISIPFVTLVALATAFNFLFAMQVAPGALYHNYNAWNMHKMYLISKYRCIYNEDIVPFKFPRAEWYPIKIVDHEKIKIAKRTERKTILKRIYLVNPVLAKKIMKFSIDIFWFIHFGWIIAIFAFYVAFTIIQLTSI